ncbi:MAG: hypothetical protein R3E31_01540 [Chloroflexota bacterium]
MRIALFTETFLPKVDGIVNTLCHLLEHLAVRGHDSPFCADQLASVYARTPLVTFRDGRFPLTPNLNWFPPPSTFANICLISSLIWYMPCSR